jgi:hypothetical protein
MGLGIVKRLGRQDTVVRLGASQLGEYAVKVDDAEIQDLNTVSSELLYRQVKTDSIERLFEGVDVVGNEAGKDISRHPKKHWLAKIEEIRLTIDTWTPSMGPVLEAVLGSDPTAHTVALQRYCHQ